MIATVLPRRAFFGHSLNALVPGIAHEKLLFFVALLNSLVFDYSLRQRVSSNITMFYIYQIPAPFPVRTTAALLSIVRIAARLICTTSEFADLWQETIGSPWAIDVAANDPAERASLRAELDGLVAHLYGLTEDEFAYILTTFPVVSQEVKEAALAAYQALAPRPGDPEILALIEQGEGAELELKSTARWDLREEKKNPDLEAVIRLTVTGFLNAHGGTLLIGVADDGSIVGLEPDYRTLKKANRDGFELFLSDLLLGAIGKDLGTCLRVTFHEVDGKDICRVTVTPGPRPVFLKEGNDEVFYLRTGNSTRRLSIREAVQYCKTRWKG